ncbi:MAG: tetratricopeptide repeat protein [Desulfobacter sp.]
MTTTDHFTNASTAWDQGRLDLAFNEFLKGARAGDEDCQISTGYFYDNGLHVEKNQDNALFWYHKAYKAGNASGAGNIATIWRDRKHYTKALWWFHRAVSLGDGDALIEIARMYEQGTGVKKSSKNAVRFYRKVLSHTSVVPHSRELAREAIQRLTPSPVDQTDQTF